MALGTFTSKRDTNNSLHVAKFTLVGDGAYPTGGTASFTDFMSLKLEKEVTIVDVKGIGTGYVLTYDFTNDKLKAFDGTLTEPANATDLSGVTFDMTVVYE